MLFGYVLAFNVQAVESCPVSAEFVTTESRQSFSVGEAGRVSQLVKPAEFLSRWVAIVTRLSFLSLVGDHNYRRESGVCILP